MSYLRRRIPIKCRQEPRIMRLRLLHEDRVVADVACGPGMTDYDEFCVVHPLVIERWQVLRRRLVIDTRKAGEVVLVAEMRVKPVN